MSKTVHRWPIQAHTRVSHQCFVAVALLTAFTALTAAQVSSQESMGITKTADASTDRMGGSFTDLLQ
jgi:hypothetical protein